jgi:hypothetical protein
MKSDQHTLSTAGSGIGLIRAASPCRPRGLSGRGNRGRAAITLGLASLIVAVVVSAASAAPALAAQTRELDSVNTGETPPSAALQGPFQSNGGLAVGPADNLWVIEKAGAIDEYDPLGGFLAQFSGGGHIGAESFPRLESIALDDATGSFYLGAGGGQIAPSFLRVFDRTGAFLTQLEYENNQLLVAVDNSGGAGGAGEGEQERVYIANGESQGTVEAFTPGLEPHPFSASASYIEGSKITGTPSGPFGQANQISTDDHGDLFVVDRFNGIDEFEPSGRFVMQFTGAEVPGGFSLGNLVGVAVDPTDGNVLVTDGDVIDEFDSAGKFLGQIVGPSPAKPFTEIVPDGIAVDSSGDLYVATHRNPFDEESANAIYKFLPVGFTLPEADPGSPAEITRTAALLSAQAAPTAAGEEITKCAFEFVGQADYKPWEDNPYATGATAGIAPCLNAAGETVGTPGEPIVASTALHANLTGLHAGNEYHWRLSITGNDAGGTPRNTIGEDFQTLAAVGGVETGAATEITKEGALLHGSFSGDGNDTSYYFEFGTSTNYGQKSTVLDQGTGSGTQTVSGEISGLVAATTYHYRLVAENQYGSTHGEDQTFETFQPPTIEGLSSSNLSATGAIIHARFNPNGFATTYRFEYGISEAYGQSTPTSEITLELSEGHVVEAQLTGLQPNATYHFRVVAENKWGAVASNDQTFEFLPPACPNAAVRQQDAANYLPDCRAYELVSPGNAEGTLLFAGGPNPGAATNPSRFAYVGDFSSLPGVDNAINTTGDLYVATRSSTGWTSKYIGLSGNEAGCVGVSPNSPYSHRSSPERIQDSVLTDPAMSRFLDFQDGTAAGCAAEGNGTGDANANEGIVEPSDAPYLWSSEGALLGHLPTGVAALPGAAAALSCPASGLTGAFVPICTSEVTASGDLSHLIFSSNQFAFAPGGLTSAPGSAYDEDLATGTVSLISDLPASEGGGDIPQDPTYAAGSHAAEEFIRFPAVSTDGSHILMSTTTAFVNPHCLNEVSVPCPSFTSVPVHLYMRVSDSVTYDVSQGHAVDYVGMTPDGSKVFFTSTEQLTAEDKDTSADLYMWSEAGEKAGHPLTLISKGDNEGNAGEPGNSDACASPWTVKCGVATYSDFHYSQLKGGKGGNGLSDNSIAADNGDIYFYSPEQLEGTHGVLGEHNLYDYRDGRVDYVATFSSESSCTGEGNGEACSDGPIARMQVSPEDTHAAFITASKLTSYENAGHLEMYSYAPAAGSLVCDSCNPDGQPPTADVYASQDGLFMTDDGRTFFSTEESLVPRDTNEGEDVYEYSGGRPQLISTGTGTVHLTGTTLATTEEVPGLVGVSADGTDVYFSTYDTLLSEDHNGSFLKFYDARSGGGFPQPTPVPPCAAAEECHGAGSSAPSQPTQGTAASLSDGNVASPTRHAHKHKKHTHKHKKHHDPKNQRRRTAKRGRGGAR